jgi:hypothetical protein
MTDVLSPAISTDDACSHLYMWLHGHMPYCGCYVLDEAVALVIDVLGLIASRATWPEVTAQIGGSDATVHIVMGVIEDAGLVSHGTSVRSSWITARGAWVRRVHSQFTSEDLDHTGYPHDGNDCPPEYALGHLSITNPPH